VPPRIEFETARGYTLGELMVAAAAREIHDGEIVFVGMRLPLLGFLVAKRTHAPNAVGLYENGLIRQTPAPELLYTMADPPNLLGATQCGPMLDVMGLLQQGHVQVGFLGAAEVDRFGNLNSTWAHPFDSAQGKRGDQNIRLPGSGGACDIACLAQRTVVVIPHERNRLVERVQYVTSPGYGTGNSWRRTQGLPGRSGPTPAEGRLSWDDGLRPAGGPTPAEGRPSWDHGLRPAGGPTAIVTTLGVLRFGSDGEAFLATVHPGVQVEEVLANTGWTLRLADKWAETPAPAEAELAVMRELDPNRFWTK